MVLVLSDIIGCLGNWNYIQQKWNYTFCNSCTIIGIDYIISIPEKQNLKKS